MSDAMHSLLAATPLLDVHHPDIEAPVARRGWRALPPRRPHRRRVRLRPQSDRLRLQRGDELPASSVLADGISKCNTKSTLLMAMQRAAGIPCRFHGFTIDKPLRKGAITGLADWLAPQRTIHSWVEVSLEGRWIALEGIADDFGVFDSPDVFCARHGSNLSGIKRWLYERVIRHAMNRKVVRIRALKW
ncbi:MAG: transglutaminase-like domain-containing protein [Pseudomonadota bacterium]